jgi:DNA polymerase-3 subunit alpha
VAVFQLESRGMQGMLKDAQPDRFEDIIALVALYRPGPMDLIPDFCRRKHGERFDYPDPRTEGILSETYGIMVYQEQVMQMAQVVGGYSLGGADLLRRAMGKKKPEEMAEHRQIFRAGAAKNGLSDQKADEIFDLMEKFAGYGFNKSHAAAYALLAYHTAYLKAHHPAAFMAANLSLAMDDTDKIKVLVEDAIHVCGLTLLPPDINHSEHRFTPVGQADANQAAKEIRYGLGAIKGSGQSAIENIVAARQSGGPFTGLFDFTQRVDKRQVTRRTMEALIRAGAFDCFGVDRGVLFANIELAMEYAEQAEAARNQASLFDDDVAMSGPPAYLSAPAWSEKRKLAEEKLALGFYLSGHLFSIYREETRQFIRTPLAKLEAARESRFMAGIIAGIRTQMTQRGKILIVTLDDATATQEVTVYAELADEFKHYFEEDEFLAVRGRISEDKFSGGLRVTADKVMDIAQARIQFAQGLRVQIKQGIDLQQLQAKLHPHLNNQGCPLLVQYQNPAARAELRFSDAWRVNPDEELQQKLIELLSAEDVAVIYG